MLLCSHNVVTKMQVGEETCLGIFGTGIWPSTRGGGGACRIPASVLSAGLNSQSPHVSLLLWTLSDHSTKVLVFKLLF